MNEFIIDMALEEMPVSGWTCGEKQRQARQRSAVRNG
jgi:hypothetical protein